MIDDEDTLLRRWLNYYNLKDYDSLAGMEVKSAVDDRGLIMTKKTQNTSPR